MQHSITQQKAEMIFLPEVTQKKYAELIGVSPDTVRGMVQRGAVPTIKRGKHRLINLAMIYAENTAAA